MILKHETVENTHYYYVMAWSNDSFRNAPVRKKRFDIYDDAVDFYDAAVAELCPECYVQMFEYIDGKRKMIMTTEDGDE